MKIKKVGYFYSNLYVFILIISNHDRSNVKRHVKPDYVPDCTVVSLANNLFVLTLYFEF